MSIEIETIIDNYYEWFTDDNDLSNINSVYDVLESLHDYLDSVNLDRDFNIYNVIGYYEIDDLDGLDRCFNAPYNDDDKMDLKIELIDNIIRLVME